MTGDRRRRLSRRLSTIRPGYANEMSPGVTPRPGGSVGVILSYPRAPAWNDSAFERRPAVRSPHRWTTRLSPPPQKLANSITLRPISLGSCPGSVIDTVLRIAKFVLGV